MSKAGEEEDQDECFHDSLDRLLSSSNSSCSCSPYSSSSESEDPNYSFSNPDDSVPVIAPGLPTRVSTNYDVWISEPSSVQDRRLRLLHQMGLANDPSFVRHQSPEGSTELAGSVSSEELNNEKPGESIDCCKSYIQKSFSSGLYGSHNEFDTKSVSGIIRSKSEGECKSTIGLSNSDGVVHNNQNYNKVHNFAPGGFVNGVQIGNNNGSLNKPPKWRVKTYSKDSEGRGLRNDEVKEALEGDDLHKAGDPGSPVCTIKNLDTGKQFVVNEVREDGMWNKLKEVGTGQQLTMEEFEMCVGTSPIVQELMRRQGVEEGNRISGDAIAEGRDGNGSKVKKRGSWLKSLRNVASSVTRSKEGRSSDERDTSSEKGARRSSSATDESQEASFPEPKKVRVRQSGKSSKELTAVYRTQEIQAHKGSIWTIKFSLDGKYLATAGEDCIIHVWQVVESERKGDLVTNKPEDMNVNISSVANGSPEPTSLSPNVDGQPERRRRSRSSAYRKYVNLEQVRFPEKVFALSEKPFCSFQGHLADVLDLSWSKSQHLLSSSMDKTVRLWNLSSKSCLKIFSHSDYVTCIDFNPVDDGYFLSGSLDAKVRIWSIPERKVVDWNDLHEMVTAACYTPDGQGALVGSYKGSCHLYETRDNKLQQRSLINLRSKKKSQKKITGFQFAPGSTLEVLITSADSRIRVVDGTEMVHKFKGLRNTNSQISASFTTNGKYVVSASEDSHVYVWRHEGDSRPSRSKGVTVTQAYESFHCRDVSAAIPWPGVCEPGGSQYSSSREHNFPVNGLDEMSAFDHPLISVEETTGSESSPCASGSGHGSSPIREKISSSAISFFFDRSSATWPEEKLSLAVKNCASRVSGDFSTEETRTAWGMVIVTAGLKGDIRTFQNFGLPH